MRDDDDRGDHRERPAGRAGRSAAARAPARSARTRAAPAPAGSPRWRHRREASGGSSGARRRAARLRAARLPRGAPPRSRPPRGALRPPARCAARCRAARPRRRAARLRPPCAARRGAPAARGALLRRRAVALERPQRGQRVVAGQVEAPAVGDDRVVGALGAAERRRCPVFVPRPDRAPVAEVGEVDDAADHGGRAGDLAAGVVGPAHPPGARVERVEAPVVGADEHGPPATAATRLTAADA